MKEASRYIGAPARRYKSREQGMGVHEGFDCSGFVTFLFTNLNIPLSEGIRHCDEYFKYFGDFVHEGLQRGGDLVFFSSNGIFPTHMGIMTDKNHFIHAPGQDGQAVRIDPIIKKPIPIHEAYVVKQIYSSNPIGYKRIVIPELRLKVR